jgi:hypothetical protein
MVRASWKRRGFLLALVGGFTLSLGSAFGQEPVIYPAKGQTQEQMQKDKSECYNWAKGQSGFDPMAPPTASSPPPQQGAPQGGVVKGAARGAVVGVAVGAIAGDAGKGAAIGAAGGGLMGGMRRRDQAAQEQHAQQQWEQQQAANLAQKRGVYNRNFAACMEGRGYTVK